MTIETGYCSHCFKFGKHQLEEQNYLRRNVYRCLECGQRTLQCRYCSNFARGSVKWDDECCAEHSGEISSFETLNAKLDYLEDYENIFKRNSINIKKVATITAMTIGGVATITPLAFVAAPAIGGAIGSLAGLSGVAAVNSGLATLGAGSLAVGGLGVAGGTAVVTATGAALGGTIGGVISNSYFGDIEDFSIIKIKDGIGKPILFVNGFLTQKDSDTTDWESSLQKIYPDNPWYHVTWESKRLLDIGKDFVSHGSNELISKKIFSLASGATKVGATKLSPIANILTLAGLVNNPWSVATVKASETGALLADIIARTNDEYILCGHSLGARVIFYALEALSTKEKIFIDSLHLMGGAVGNDKNDWEKAKKAVKNKIYNYKSNNDKVLSILYKAGTFLVSDPIGRNNINVNGIENIDVTNLVDGHTEYKKNFYKFFYK